MRGSVIAAVLGGLAGCGFLEDVREAVNPFNWFSDSTSATAGGETAVSTRGVDKRDGSVPRVVVATDDERGGMPYPQLGNVPERPTQLTSTRARQERDALREGLIADREHARYSEEVLQARTSILSKPSVVFDPERRHASVAEDAVPAAPAAGLAIPPLPSVPEVPAPQIPMPPADAAVPPVEAPELTAIPKVTPPPMPDRPRTEDDWQIGPHAQPPSMPREMPDPPALQAAAESAVRVATIYFDDGSSRLGEGARALTRRLAEAMMQQDGRLRVIGHAGQEEVAGDGIERKREHYAMSLERAETVSEELVRLGISRDRLAVLAEGDYLPVYQETAPTGAAGNRRTEIFLEPAYLAEVMGHAAQLAPSTAGKPVKASLEQRPAPDPAAAGLADETVTFIFALPEQVAAAVFSRPPYVWIVFDRRVQVDVGSLRAQGRPLLDTIEQLPVIDSTVLRLRSKERVSPHVQRMQGNWIVTFERAPVEPQIPIAAVVCAQEAKGARVVFPATELGSILTIRDPGVGDLLQVVTSHAPGHGIGDPRRYAQFEILPSAQGVAVASLTDGLEIAEAGSHGVMVQAPGGLQLSWMPAPVKPARDAGASARFDLDDWHCGDAALAGRPDSREPV